VLLKSKFKIEKQFSFGEVVFCCCLNSLRNLLGDCDSVNSNDTIKKKMSGSRSLGNRSRYICAHKKFGENRDALSGRVINRRL